MVQFSKALQAYNHDFRRGIKLCGAHIEDRGHEGRFSEVMAGHLPGGLLANRRIFREGTDIAPDVLAQKIVNEVELWLV
jgi:hypothetical protein